MGGSLSKKCRVSQHYLISKWKEYPSTKKKSLNFLSSKTIKTHKKCYLFTFLTLHFIFPTEVSSTNHVWKTSAGIFQNFSGERSFEGNNFQWNRSALYVPLNFPLITLLEIVICRTAPHGPAVDVLKLVKKMINIKWGDEPTTIKREALSGSFWLYVWLVQEWLAKGLLYSLLFLLGIVLQTRILSLARFGLGLVSSLIYFVLAIWVVILVVNLNFRILSKGFFIEGNTWE